MNRRHRFIAILAAFALVVGSFVFAPPAVAASVRRSAASPLPIPPGSNATSPGSVTVASSRSTVISLADAGGEFRLPSEPWIFVMDEQGTVTARLEGVLAPGELEELLDA